MSRMRWLQVLLFTCIACHANGASPLPDIQTGTSAETFMIERRPWDPGRFLNSNAFLVCQVVRASSEVRTTPQQTSLTESCDVRVTSAFGHRDAIRGIQRARLTGEYEQSPYVPVDSDWGRLRHLMPGQTVVVLLDAHEQELSFGSKMLIEVHDNTHTLPTILQRTALDPNQFTMDDLQVLETASPFLAAQVVKERMAGIEQRTSKASWLVSIVIIAGLLLLCVMIWRKSKTL